jgi:hypothetical protein
MADTIGGAFVLPAVLQERINSSSAASVGRCMENEEVAIVSLLDGDGNLSTQACLDAFMVLMTRITRIDHRALCVEVLMNRLDKAFEAIFVAHGGFKILKRWIKGGKGSCL